MMRICSNRQILIKGECIKCHFPVARVIEVKLKKPITNVASNYVKLPSLYSIPKNANIHKTLFGYPKLEVYSTGSYTPRSDELGFEECDDEMLEIYADVVRRGNRKSWEMEQVLPGYDPESIDCPILVGIDIASTQGYDAGIRHFKSLLKKDPRCQDAYAHLGLFYFEQNNSLDTEKAKNFYKQGAFIGFSAIGIERMRDVFLWGHIDNRPFLRCLEGYALCLAREGQTGKALTVFEQLLLFNPYDNQGARFNISNLNNNRPFECI